MPHEGMSFHSHEESYNFYNSFGLTHGFAVRKYYTYKSRKDEVIVRRTFVCNREGFKKKQEADNEDNIKRRRETKCGCKASMEIILNKLGTWEIKKFNDIHSHDLLKSPNKRRKLRSHNKSYKDATCKKLIDKFSSYGVGPAKISRIINSASGSAIDVSDTPTMF
ncbi:hypothetical protein DCAR_0933983 [Daucus carota subsp. sativus]|uniref:FAR1 domain-containing protein n=1 Tax=Daucus carota subsp. sativus TaxID=79200 RepID=A0AAF1BCC7_DAUCS|nr:hypothetical protein DCAR_0933983 [Daucus carota subsp. sativus]